MQSISNIDIKYCRYQYLILTDYHEEYWHPHCAEGTFGKTFGFSDSSSSIGGSGGRAGLEIIWNFPTCLHSPKRSMAWWITFRFIQHLTKRLEKRQPNHFLSISILSHALSSSSVGLPRGTILSKVMGKAEDNYCQSQTSEHGKIRVPCAILRSWLLMLEFIWVSFFVVLLIELVMLH